MRIGIICEGEITDAPVLREILAAYFPDKTIVVIEPCAESNELSKADILIRGLSKSEIFANGNLWLADIFNRGMHRALIIWDLLPPGHQMAVPAQKSDRPNRREQRETLLKRLCETNDLPCHIRQQAQYHVNRYQFGSYAVEHPNGGDDLFKLVCVCYTLDGWLLADGDVLRGLASTKVHTASRWKPPQPDACQRPAAELGKYFVQGTNPWFKHYNKRDHNIEIAKAYREQDKISSMETSQSFSYAINILRRWMQR